MPGNAAVKSTARAALKGIWLGAIACTLLLFGAAFVAVYAGVLFSTTMRTVGNWLTAVFAPLFCLFVVSPLFLGVLRYFWRATAGGKDAVLSVFYYFESLSRYIYCIKFLSTLLIRLALIVLAVFSPFIAIKLILLAPGDVLSEQLRMQLSFASSVFASLGTVFFVIFSVRFYLSPALFVACDNLDRHEILYLSKTVSRQTAGAFIVLAVGMLGWLLLSAFGITLIYTVPYMIATYVIHCRFAINHHNRKAHRAQETDFPEYRSDF